MSCKEIDIEECADFVVTTGSTLTPGYTPAPNKIETIEDSLYFSGLGLCKLPRPMNKVNYDSKEK